MHPYPQPADHAPSTSSLDRTGVDARYTWNLDDIFSSWEEWDAAFQQLEAAILDLKGLQGRLATGPDSLLRFYQLRDDAGKLFDRVWYYPALRFDLDQRDNAVNARRQRVEDLAARFAAATSWFSPEVVAIGEETVMGWLDSHPDLALYRFHLAELFRQAEHVLGEEAENVLALSSRVGSAPSSAYSMLTTADARFPEVELSDGSRQKVTPGSYGALLRTLPEQDDRRTVFEAHFKRYVDTANTYAALYNGVLQRGIFHARARNYPSVLARKLDSNAIPESVVTTLVDTARQGMEPMRRYHALRKRALGLDEYYLFDSFAAIQRHDRRYDYDDAAAMIIRSVAPLGDEYQARVQAAFDQRWVDAYEAEGKRSGGYMASVYGIHPFILMNYHGTLDDVFTLAHEMGHAMHSVLADESQPFTYAGYTIFIAEVASTLNEALLLDEMLQRADTPAERIGLLQHAIDGAAGTFFTQSLFAAYELEAHRRAENGEPVTRDSLSEIYQSIIESWYGDAITSHDLYRYTWTRIPHFYQSPYYVYQYATSYAASAAVFQAMREATTETDRSEVVDRYLTLLRAGGSDHPMTLLRNAGVDLSQPAPVEAVVRRTRDLVDRLEAELAAVDRGTP